MIKDDIQEGISEYKKYQKKRISHWDNVASITDNTHKQCSGYYHKRLNKVLKFVIRPINESLS